jgi:hypothetical protein
MKVFQISSIIVLLVFTACSSDSPIANPLVGSWQFSYEQYSNCDDPADDGKFDYECNSNTCFKYIFDSNYNYEYQALSNGMLSSQQGTYTIDNGKLTLCSGGCADPVDFDISNSTITLTFSDAQGCTIARVLIKVL